MARFSLSILALAGLALFATADEAPKGAADTHTGVIAAVDAKVGTLKLKVGNDRPVTNDYSFLRDTKVALDGKDAKLDDLKVGMKVTIVCKPGATEVVSVSTHGKVAKARLLGVDAAAGTVQVTGAREGGKETLGKDVRIVIDGKEAKVGDLPATGVVQLKYNSAGDKVIEVVLGRGDGDKPGEKPAQPGERRVNTRGVVKAFNPATGELVLTIAGEGGRVTDRDFKIDKDAAVYDGKTPLKLDAVKVGQEITVRYSQEGRVIERINLVAPAGKEPEKKEGDKK